MSSIYLGETELTSSTGSFTNAMARVGPGKSQELATQSLPHTCQKPSNSSHHCFYQQEIEGRSQGQKGNTVIPTWDVATYLVP